MFSFGCLVFSVPVLAGEGGGEVDCSDESQGLTTHHAFVSFSRRAKRFSEDNAEIFASASVPDVLKITRKTGQLRKGDLVMYFNRDVLCRSVSRDGGVTWTTPRNVAVSGLRNDGGVVDPSVVQLPSGKIRLFFYGPSESGGDPALIPGDHVIYSAISDHGLRFTVQRRRRLSAESMTDPEVVRLGDLWLLYTSQGQTTHIATSDDGQTFTDTGETWNGGGIPGAYAHDGVVDIFGCSGSSIMVARASDGIHFGESTEVFRSSEVVCDPSPVKLSSDAYALFYKKVIDD